MHSGKMARQVFFFLYNGMLLAGLFFLLPLIIYAVKTTAKRRHTFPQRMGWCRYPWQSAGGGDSGKCIWVHALSVGEVRAAQPMVVRLRALHPEMRICLSASTFSGFQTAGQLFGNQERIDLAYFPYDVIWAVRNVVARINPSQVILTETDIWPNFLMEMQRRQIPVNLINLRISDSSWRNYRRFKLLARLLFSTFEKIGVQTQRDLERLEQLGADYSKAAVTGNIKFDGIMLHSESNPANFWKSLLNITPGQPVIVAGSTHEGEEDILFKVLSSMFDAGNQPVLVVAPRDPQRGHEIIGLCRKQGLTCGLLSLLKKQGAQTFCPNVVVVDYIGVLKELYSLADVAFVGGSLVPCGGHNPLEPAAWGKPVLFGPDMSDFLLISELLLEAQGALRVFNFEDLLVNLEFLITHPESALTLGQNAMHVIRSHQGAVERNLKFLGLISGSQCELHLSMD